MFVISKGGKLIKLIVFCDMTQMMDVHASKQIKEKKKRNAECKQRDFPLKLVG